MTRPEILSELQLVFARVFGKPVAVTDETTAKDVPDWDSLNHTLLIAAVEDHFKIKFTLKEVIRFQSVGDMCKTIGLKLGG